MIENQETPIHIHKGKNHFRHLAIIFLIAIILLSLYSIRIIGYSMILVILASVFGLISIRFPFIYLFSDHLVISKKGLLKKYNDQEIYDYNEIKDIEYKEGYIKLAQMIVQTIFGQGAYGGFSKPDQMNLKLRNNKLKIIYRFGTKKDFEELINKILKLMKPRT